jgi:hypothetical protein
MAQADVSVEPVTVAQLPAAKAGDAKVFTAGKAAIAKASTLAELTKVTERMELRRADLSDEQYQQLMQLALDRETQLSETPQEDPFGDD